MSEPLTEIIRTRIRAEGAMDIGGFMGQILGHPEYGYYMRQDPFGAAGDFTTAPEISQMFGELVGAWVADLWIQMGRPRAFAFLECGPGRGTLMADALRATAKVPGFHTAAQIHFLETSPVLRAAQADAVKGFEPLWHEGLETIPGHVPLILVANEFLDALPVRQLIKGKDGWGERVVTLDEDGRFIYGQKSVWPGLIKGIPQKFQIAPEGAIFEFSPARDGFVKAACALLKKQKGAALFVDYGHLAPGLGDTLHAIRNHEHVPVLESAGAADLSANVNFGQLAAVAKACGASVSGPVGQGAFLKALGIEPRAEILKGKASDKQQDDIEKALRRLVNSGQMGTLFQVIGLSYGDTFTLTGF